jgi:hypothetical protein
MKTLNNRDLLLFRACGFSFSFSKIDQLKHLKYQLPIVYYDALTCGVVVILRIKQGYGIELHQKDELTCRKMNKQFNCEISHFLNCKVRYRCFGNFKLHPFYSILQSNPFYVVLTVY